MSLCRNMHLGLEEHKQSSGGQWHGWRYVDFLEARCSEIRPLASSRRSIEEPPLSLRLFLPFDHAENGQYKRRRFTACERESLFLKVHRPQRARAFDQLLPVCDGETCHSMCSGIVE